MTIFSFQGTISEEIYITQGISLALCSFLVMCTCVRKIELAVDDLIVLKMNRKGEETHNTPRCLNSPPCCLKPRAASVACLHHGGARCLCGACQNLILHVGIPLPHLHFHFWKDNNTSFCFLLADAHPETMS